MLNPNMYEVLLKTFLKHIYIIYCNTPQKYCHIMLWPYHRVSSISFIFIPSSYPVLSFLNLFLYFVFCVLLHTMFVRQLWMIFPSAYDSWAVITSKRPQWSYTSPAIVWNICHVSHPVLAELFEHVAHDTYTFTSKHQFNWFPTSFFMSEYWKCPHRS